MGSLLELAAVSYQVDFAHAATRNYAAHRRFPLVLLPKFVPAPVLGWLAEEGTLLQELAEYLCGERRDGALAELVGAGDRESVRRNLLTGPRQRFATARTAPLIERLMEALRRMLADGAWLPLNRDGAAGWVADDAVWFVSKRLADEVRRFLQAQGDHAVPGEDKNDRLFDVWQEYGALVPNPATGGAIWRARVEGADYAHELTLLRFPLTRLYPEATRFPSAMQGRIVVLPATDAAIATDSPRSSGRRIRSLQSPTTTRRSDRRCPQPRAAPALLDPSDDATTLEPCPPIAPRRGSRCRRPSVHYRHCTKAQRKQPSALALEFMAWVQRGVADGSLAYNESGALVHFVAEGLFLVSPGLFRAYADAHPAASNAEPGGAKDWPGKAVQKAVCGAGWNRKGPRNKSVLTYQVVSREGKPGKSLNGVVVLQPERFFAPVPPANPHLQPAPDAEREAQRMTYPLENLFRPAVERHAAIAALAAASGVIAWPEVLMLTPGAGLVVAALLFAHALRREAQAERVLRFQRHLRQPPHYVLAADRIPWSRHKLFLGRGFRWTAVHTQRLVDSRRPEYAHFREPTWLYRLARRFELRHEHTGLAWATALTRRPARWNPVAPMPEVGGDPALHGVEPDERDVYLPLAERVGHMVVVGTTRTGKSRFLELLVAQDIRRGETVIVFDPKGDADVFRRVYAEAKRAGRMGQFHFFHLGYPHCSARYNPIGDFARITEVATRIANNMPSGGDAESFKQFVWKYVNGLVRAMVALGRKPSYRALHRYAENFEPLILDYFMHWLDREPQAAGWRDEVAGIEIDNTRLDKALKSRGGELVKLLDYAKRKQLYDSTASALASVVTYENSYFQKLVASLYPFLEKVTTGEIADLVSPDYENLDDPRPGIRLDDDPEQWRHRLCRPRFAGRPGRGDRGGQRHVRRSHQCRGQGLQARAGLWPGGGGASAPARHSRRRVQRSDRRRVHPHGQQGGWGRVSGHCLYPDLGGRGSADRQPGQGRADRGQLQFPRLPARRQRKDRRDHHPQAARGAADHPHRRILRHRYQRSERLCRVRQPQRRSHRLGAGPDAHAGRPGQSAQGPGLCADRRGPTLQDPHAATRQRQRPGDAEGLCGNGPRHVAALSGASGSWVGARSHGGREGQWLLERRRFMAVTRGRSWRHSVTWPT